MILEQSVCSEEQCCPASGKRPSGEIRGLGKKGPYRETVVKGILQQKNIYLKKRAVSLLLR
jgi:hypothetical protein